jgi:chloramphenicol-sensitive protein RarD
VNTDRRGVAYGLAAYLIWGLFPLYFRLLERSSVVEILLYRYLWALPVCAAVILATRAGRQLRTALRSARLVAMLSASAGALALTSGVYIYAVNSGRVIEASLGYFINPLVTVALGVVVLRERLRPAQWAAVGTGALAVVVLTLDYGRPPWIALALAGSFGAYGLVKNRVGDRVGALVGLTTETIVLAPLAVVGLVAIELSGRGTFTTDPPWHALLLASGGIAIVAPLLPFAAAARRVSLATLGLLQYLTPVMQLVCGLLLGERIESSRWIGFVLIWVALAILSADRLRAARAPAPAPRQAVTAARE